MTEELKLIEGILAHAEDERINRSWASDDVGWENVDAIWNKAEQLKELLKKQEAVTIKKTKEHGFGVYGGICPKCNNWIQSAHSFCGYCGQAVKWDG